MNAASNKGTHPTAHHAGCLVTDHIDTFTETGQRLKSGENLSAVIIVTATGLVPSLMSGLQLVADGAAVDLPKTLVYKGMMFSKIPNLAFAIGYTNASWTLKCDLTAEYVCRLLNHMDRRGYAVCTPRVSDGKTSSASSEGTIKLCGMAPHSCVDTLGGHKGSVRDLAFSPDGKTLASAGDDNTIRLWDVGSVMLNTLKGRGELATLKWNTEGVKSVAFSPDGRTLASGSSDKTVRLWHALFPADGDNNIQPQGSQ